MFKRFKTSLPPVVHEVLAAVGVLSRDMGSRAYLVGGIVRDVVIGYSNIDLDIVIDGDGVEVARRFGTSKVKSRAFGTVDFATARTESYRRPGALPDVERSTIGKDLARRDFTINAMAISLDPSDYGGLIDPYRGLKDISGRRLRVLHDRSFLDDPTRVLRGVRFAARYNFRFETNTLRILKECMRAGCLRSISGKRAYGELRHICAADRPVKGLRMLERYGMLGGMHPAIRIDGRRLNLMGRLGRSIESVERSAGGGFVGPWLCWFSSLFVGVGRRRAASLTAYFNLPAHVRDVCLWVSSDLKKAGSRLDKLAPTEAYEVTRLLGKIPREGIVHLYAVSARRERGLIRKYLSGWRHVAPHLSGGEIASLGVGEGPLVGKILDDIVRLRLEGKIKTRADELTYIRKVRL
jgi:tRNA nucleotidyltransferase (CCA-adding enzyme)